jgi:hypothetical protein
MSKEKMDALDACIDTIFSHLDDLSLKGVFQIAVPYFQFWAG